MKPSLYPPQSVPEQLEKLGCHPWLVHDWMKIVKEGEDELARGDTTGRLRDEMAVSDVWTAFKDEKTGEVKVKQERRGRWMATWFEFVPEGTDVRTKTWVYDYEPGCGPWSGDEDEVSWFEPPEE